MNVFDSITFLNFQHNLDFFTSQVIQASLSARGLIPRTSLNVSIGIYLEMADPLKRVVLESHCASSDTFLILKRVLQ